MLGGALSCIGEWVATTPSCKSPPSGARSPPPIGFTRMDGLPGLVRVAESEAPDSETAIYRNSLHPFELVRNFNQYPLRSCWEFVARAASALGPDREYLFFRPVPDAPYRGLSYNQMAEFALHFSRGLDALGCCRAAFFTPRQLCMREGVGGGSTARAADNAAGAGADGAAGEVAVRSLGVYSKNRVEWYVSELAANLNALTLVPLYDTLGKSAMAHILRETGMSTVLSDFDCFPKLVALLESNKHHVAEIVVTPPNTCDAGYHFPISRGLRAGRPVAAASGTATAAPAAAAAVSRAPLFCCCMQCGHGADCWTRDTFKAALQKASHLEISVLTFGGVLDVGRTTELTASAGVDDGVSLSNETDAAVLAASDLNLPNALRAKSELDTLQTICYTSGTTGSPKGVILRHRELIAMVTGLMRVIFTHPSITICEDDCHISYLPLAHIFERVVSNIAVVSSARIGIFAGDIRNLTNDLQALKPTVMIVVPKVLERIVDQVYNELHKKPRFIQNLFEKALQVKIARVKADPQNVTHLLYDRIFSKVRNSLGGKLKWVICGGAPLSSDLAATASALLSASVVQGYGMTETLAVSAVTLPGIPPDSVGPPSPTVEVKLRSVPSMGYNVRDHRGKPTGELLIRGTTVCSGYLGGGPAYEELLEWPDTESECGGSSASSTPNNENLSPVGRCRRGALSSPRKLPTAAPLETATLPWLLTGDIAQFDLTQGVIRIIDRKKNLLKMSQGEYVAPERLEGIFQRRIPAISQIFVHAEPTESKLVAIVSVNWLAAAQALNADADALLIEHQQVEGESDENDQGEDGGRDTLLRRYIMNALEEAAVAAGLAGFERVKNVHLTTLEFTPENGLLTPTMKLKRHELRNFFRGAITNLYVDIRRRNC